MYRSLARWCYRHARFVVGIWIAAIIAINIGGAAVGAAFDSAFSTPESESTRGFALIERSFPGAGSQFGGSIVFTSQSGIDEPSVKVAMTKMFRSVDALDGVAVVSPFEQLGSQQVAPDRKTAFAQVNLEPDVDSTESATIGKRIAALAPTADGLRVEIGGAALAEVATPETELIGLAFAIVVLIIAFGSVLAMGLPIGIALAGVATGAIGLVSLLSNTMTVPDFAPFIGIMIGLGIGIDYALFIVTRFRELTHAGETPEAAIEGAIDTAGRAVVVAGATVVLSLLGMLLIGMAFISGLGVAAATTVAVTVVASLTLLPALLAMLGNRLEVTRWRGLIAAASTAVALLGIGLGISVLGMIGAIGAIGTILASFAFRPLRKQVPHRRIRPTRDTLSYRWSRIVQARPWAGVLVGGGLLLLLSVPVLGLRLGFSDEGNYRSGTGTRVAYDLVADGFGPGFNGPLLLAVDLAASSVSSTDSAASGAPIVELLLAAVRTVPGVVSVSPPFPNQVAAPTAFLIQIIPTTSPQDATTADTVARVRNAVAPIVARTGITADLTGAVPANIDISAYLAKRIPLFFGAVLAVSFLLLMMVFRSVLVPLKAVFMNVLSISASYGVVVALFQWGWFGSWTGIEPAPIEPFIPMMLFAIVFGMSMDYEVFLLSRVKEEFDRTGDSRNSVADGLAATARVISAAAAIMVVVFGAFLLEDNRITKLFGTGLALAILLDATLVRMLLVPSTMELLGARNWWMPRWLDRLTPTIHVGAHSQVASNHELIHAPHSPGSR